MPAKFDLALRESFVTEHELANTLGCDVRTLRRWNEQRTGPPRVKMGRTVLYRRDALMEWMRSMETKRVERAAAPQRGRRKAS